ncbi:hypothetical protein SBDP2_770005 [Syntrophobacter sp. SbD2]|nr:hypothetical protein SBDP2_770005 [Syntrophobacter sp. SbD2]
MELLAAFASIDEMGRPFSQKKRIVTGYGIVMLLYHFNCAVAYGTVPNPTGRRSDAPAPGTHVKGQPYFRTKADPGFRDICRVDFSLCGGV